MNSASAMNVLGKVCLLEYNDEIIESGLEETAYEALVKVLTVPDVKVGSVPCNRMPDSEEL